MTNRNGNELHKPGYKYTVWGWLPKDWEFNRLSEFVQKKGGIKTGPFGSSLKKSCFVGAGYKVYGQEHVISGTLEIGDYYISDEKYNELKQFKIKEGDILISLVGTLGKVLVVPETFKSGIINPRLLKIQLQRQKYHPKFFSYFLESVFVQKQLQRMSTGGTMDIINAGVVKTLKVICPTLNEQEQIVNILNCADKAISKTTRLIQLRQQRQRGLMQLLLTGKKRLPGFCGEWKQRNYIDIIKEVKRPAYWDDDELYNLISVRRRSKGIFERESLFGHQIKVKDLRTANEGDFLFSKMQIVHGASTLVTKEFAGTKISGSYIAVVAKDTNLLDINFFNWWSKTPSFYHQTYISSYGVHIEKMTFDFESFLSLGMKLPDIEEQKAIINVLQTGAKEIQLLQRKLHMLKEQKKGLMQQLLTGKKRVKV